MSTASLPTSLRQDATVISLVGYVHGTSHFYHFMFPSLFPWLMADFGLNFTQVGLTMTVFFVVSGIGQALSGFIVDRYGALRVLYGGIGLFIASGLVLAASTSMAMLLSAAFLAGLGNAVFHPVDFTLLNRRVSAPRLGHAFSVHGLSGSLGWAVAPVMLTAIATAWNWRVAGVAAALVGVLALGVAFFNRGTLDDAHAAVEPDSRKKGGTFDFLASPTVWLCFAFFLIVTLAFGALQNYSTPIFTSVYAVSIPMAASSLTAYLLASAAGTATGGFFAAKGEGQDRRVAIALSVAAVAAGVIAAAVLPAGALPVLMAVMGFCVGFSGPSRDILVRRAATSTFGQRAFGRVYGFTYSGLDVGFAIAPLVFGPMMDAGQYTHVLWGAAALQLVAITTALTVGARSRVKPA